MASYIYEMVCEPAKPLRNEPKAWDNSVYEDIIDFECTTDYASARRGQSQIMW